MIETNIIFCGLSKNNKETLVKNLEYIVKFKNESVYKNINIIIVDSNSSDGSKKYLNDLSEEYEFIDVLHKDNLDSILSRVERIKICRNMCLQLINEKFDKKSLVYIPCDTDFYLFSKTSHKQLDELISHVIKIQENCGIFPVSEPFYYDIFALRAKNWLNINSQLIVSNLKKYIKVGSFIFNYFFIFRYQLSPKQIESKKFSVISAFGGIGIYNISNFDLKNKKYDINEKSPEWHSEHLYFNSYFKNLNIMTNWIIEAPEEHVLFKSHTLKGKLFYILKTLKEDIKSIFVKKI